MTLLAVLTALAALAPAVAAAESFSVNTTEDGIDDKGCTPDHCTLREAVARAGPQDSVDVPAGTYRLELGELFLTSDTIVGKDARETIIDGGGKSRVLWVTDGTTSVSGVTVRGGNGEGPTSRGVGGGIHVQSGLLMLIASTVTSNTAAEGGGIFSGGALQLVESTVSGNTAGANGGGIAVGAERSLAIRNSTVSNNDAVEGPGGGIYSEGSLQILNATFAGNRAPAGEGLFVVAPKEGPLIVRNTILVAGDDRACDGPGLGGIDAEYSVVSDESCSFKGDGNLQAADARLLGLGNYGGPTNTHALRPASPAIEAGLRCEQTDQRGVARPQPIDGLCDVGAFEYRAPTLTVVTDVENDDGGTAAPDDFAVHVLLGKDDVEGSPQPGSVEGSTYALDAYETYTIAADAPAGYSISVSGHCAPNGNVGLIEGQNRTCTITADDQPATLHVITRVINDDGGTGTPSQFRVRVQAGGEDVASGPGDAAGTPYPLPAGDYVVQADPLAGYTLTYSAECSVTLATGDSRTCTVTADDEPATLRVTTQVVNDDGGGRTAGDFFVRVLEAGTEVAGGPGTEEATVFSLDAGSYAVTADETAGYAFTYVGDCAPTLGVGASAACTVTADDDPPPPPTVNRDQQQQPPPPPPDDEQEQQLPPPEPGENVNAEPKSGNVKVKLPGSKRFVALGNGQQLPVGTVVDARKGHVTLVAAADKTGGTATAEFWAGIFKVGQTRGARPITTLKLTEKLRCGKGGKASAAKKRKRGKRKRRLWGSGRGRFRTKGRYSSATVRGTKWLTEDRCIRTLTRVKKGKVAVRDFAKKKTVIVKRGKRYVAKRKRSR